MHTSFTRGVDRVLRVSCVSRVSRTARLTLLGTSDSPQDVANVWDAVPAGQGRLGLMLSTIPPEQFVIPSSDPQDDIQFNLSPHSQLSWSAKMNLSLTLDPQLLADTLKSRAALHKHQGRAHV